MSDINIITSGLDSILLKPFEEQIKSTFEARHKSLALLHSWDEIVYKDINRIFAFQQFDRKYRWICQNEQTLFQRLKNININSKSSKLCHPQNRSSSIHHNKSLLSCTSTPKSLPTSTAISTKSDSKSTKSSVNVITSNNETKSISKSNSMGITKNKLTSTSTPTSTPMVTIKPSITTTATTPTPAAISTNTNTNKSTCNVTYAQDNIKRNQFNTQQTQNYAQYAQYAQYNNNYNYNQKKSVNTATRNNCAQNQNQYAQYAQFNPSQKQTLTLHNGRYYQYIPINCPLWYPYSGENKNSQGQYAQYAQYAQYGNNNNNNNGNKTNNKSMSNVNKNMNNPTYYDASIQSSYQIKNGCYYYNPLNMNTNTSDCYGEITEMMVGDENSQSSQGNISALSNTNSNSSLSNVTDNV